EYVRMYVGGIWVRERDFFFWMECGAVGFGWVSQFAFGHLVLYFLCGCFGQVWEKPFLIYFCLLLNVRFIFLDQNSLEKKRKKEKEEKQNRNFFCAKKKR
ncbi:hypothetical protein, partial [Salmonella sp. s58408]|uniref:hypothetical protein n=1 Tax=Salmonella sp. s58408 TaxID=3159701 RepID=UPI0039809235